MIGKVKLTHEGGYDPNVTPYTLAELDVLEAQYAVAVPADGDFPVPPSIIARLILTCRAGLSGATTDDVSKLPPCTVAPYFCRLDCAAGEWPWNKETKRSELRRSPARTWGQCPACKHRSWAEKFDWDGCTCPDHSDPSKCAVHGAVSAAPAEAE